jgi:UPF0716 protein FxsA
MNPVIILGIAVYIGVEWLAASGLAHVIGWGGVALVMMILFIIGMAVCRRAGFAALRGREPIVVNGNMVVSPGPAQTVGDAGLRFIAGLMIALPGLVTSALGLTFLIPGVRRGAGRFGAERIRRRAAAAGLILDENFHPSTFSDGAVPGEVYRPAPPRTVIEGQIVDEG